MSGTGALAHAPPLFGIVGRKNAGKTTLMVKVIEELTSRRLVVATIKHAHHGFEVDREGTDSHAHRLAGAREVCVIGGGRWAIMHEGNDPEPGLDEMVARLSPCDIVLVEGFKREWHPKIELRRGTEPLRDDEVKNVVAIAGDGGRFAADDVGAIADFLLEHAAAT